MLFELHIRIERRILELLQERLLVEVHLLSDEFVLQLRRHAVLTPVRRGRVEERAVLDNALARLAHLLDLVRACEQVVALWVQAPDVREQACALLLAQLRPEGVDRHAQRAAVSLECEDFVHHLGGRPADMGRDEAVEVLEVGLVERVADDFDVEVVKVGRGEAIAEVGG